MPIADLLYLVGVIVAFLAFGLTLAWAQHQTKNFVRPNEAKDTASHEDRGFRKAA